MRFWFLTAASAALLGITSVLAAQSLINPEFELPGTEGQPPAGWTIVRGKFFLDSGKRSSGVFSGKLDGGDGAADAHQEVAVTPGMTYQLSGVWRNGDRAADFDRVTAEIRWLSGPGGRDMGQAAIIDSGETVSNWTPFRTPALTAPPGAGAARINLKSKFGIGAFDSLYWGPPGGTSSAPASPAPGSAAAPAPAPGSSAVIPPLTEVLSAPPAVPAPAVSGPLPTLAPSGAAAPAPSLNWLTDLRAARRTAAAEQKKILVLFAGDDEASRALEREVFGQPAVAAAMAGFVPVKLDFEKNKNLAFALQVFKTGTVTVYDAKGEFLAKLDAPLTADDLVARLKALGQ